MRKREFRKMFAEYPDILNMDDLKNMLRIGKNKSYELINSGKIYCIKMGRKNCIPKVSVINFLADENNLDYISKCQ